MACVPGIISEHPFDLPVPHLIFDHVVSLLGLKFESCFAFPVALSLGPLRTHRACEGNSEELEMKRSFKGGS